MAANASSVRAGRAFVELLVNNNALLRGLADAKKRVESWAKGLQSVAIKVGAAGTAMAAPLLKTVADFTSRGAAFKQIADRFHTSVESVSALAFGFEKAGYSLEEYGGALDAVASKISKLRDNDEFFGEELRGLTGSMLRGKDIGDQLDLIANKFSEITLGEDRVRVAGELGLSRLLPWIEKGAAGFDELRAAAKDAGAVMSLESATRSKDLADAMTAAWQELKSSLMAVGEALLPTSNQTKELAQRVADAGKAVREWVADHAGLIRTLAGVGAGLVVAGAGIAALSVVARGLAVALGVVRIAMIALGAVSVAVAATMAVVSVVVAAVKLALAAVAATATAAWAALTTMKLALTAVATAAVAVWTALSAISATSLAVVAGTGLVAVAIAGVTVALVTQTDALGTLGGMFSDLAGTAVRAWGGIVAALKKGDLELAGEIALAGLQVAWAQVVVAMTKVWNDFKSVVVDGFDEIKAGARYLVTKEGAANSLLKSPLADPFGLAGLFHPGGRDGFNADIDKALEQKFGNKEADRIGGELAQKKDARLAARDGDVKAAQARLDELQKKFQALVGKAEREEAPLPRGVGREVAPAPRMAPAMKQMADALPQLFAAVKGGFGGPVQAQFGYGDNIAQRQLNVQEKIADGAKVLPGMAKDIGAFAAAARFK